MYKRFIPYLTIQKEADISESPEYIRIKNENQVLQAETERHIVERKELQELRAELEAEKIAKAEAEEALILRVKTEAINEVMNTLKGETFDRENLSKKITLAEVFQTANKLKHGSPRKR
jgi:hypothetical protein